MTHEEARRVVEQYLESNSGSNDPEAAIVDQAYQTATKQLTKNRGKLEQLVKVLREEETIEGGALQAILDAEPGKEAEELLKAEKKPKTDEAADGSTDETSAKKTPKAEPGLAWEAPSQLDPDQH